MTSSCQRLIYSTALCAFDMHCFKLHFIGVASSLEHLRKADMAFACRGVPHSQQALSRKGCWGHCKTLVTTPWSSQDCTKIWPACASETSACRGQPPSQVNCVMQTSSWLLPTDAWTSQCRSTCQCVLLQSARLQLAQRGKADSVDDAYDFYVPIIG